MKVSIIRTGVANVASVAAALGRAGVDCDMAVGARDVDRADAVVLPGVGAFGAGVEALAKNDVGEALGERVLAGAPTLAVCLGMQLFGESSEESPGRGLGVLPSAVRALPQGTRPHFGWNEVAVDAAQGVLRPGSAYFAHSYAFMDPDALAAAGWRVATAREGLSFVAAAERGPVLLCQFHPELSGAYGAELLGGWVLAAREAQVTRW